MENNNKDILVSDENLKKLGDFIAKVEDSRQGASLAQIKAVSEDNQRQFEYAMKQSEISNHKWNMSFAIGVISAFVIGGTGLYLLINGNVELGLGLLSNTLTGVFAYLAGVGSSSK